MLNKGCRVFTEAELELYVAVAGLPEGTSKEELVDLGFTYVRDWEKTPCNEPKMRQMMATRTAESAETLMMPNPVKYLRKGYIDSIKNQNYSIGLGNSWSRSHLGISLAAVSYMIGTAEQAWLDTSRDQFMDAATHTTAADEESRLGKPGESPKGLAALIKHIGAFLIQLHSIAGLRGSHAVCVKRIRTLLLEFENEDTSVSQSDLDSIFWAITLDGRRTFESPAKARSSNLVPLVNALIIRSIVPRFDVPWQLSPPSKRKGFTVSGGGFSDDIDSDTVHPAKKKKVTREAFVESETVGAIMNYHPSIRAKWEQLCEKWGTTPLVLDVIALSNDESGKPFTFAKFGEEVVGGGLCVIGEVTGFCRFPGCKYNHNDTIGQNRAKNVCKVLDKAIGAKVAHPVKKEKTPK